MTEQAKEQPQAAEPEVVPQDLLRAAESLDRLAQTYRHITLASDAMKTVARAYVASQDLDAVIAQKKAELDAVIAEVATANEVIEQAAAHADDVRAKAVAEAAQLVEAARLQAADVVRAAGERAAEAAKEGEAERQAAIAKAHVTLNELGEQIAAARVNLDGMANLRLAKAQDLDAIEVKLQQARAAAAQILTP